MTARVWIFSVDRRREAFDGANKQLSVFLRGSLQIADEGLDLIGHHVEGVAEIAEFGATGDLDPFRKVAESNAMSTACEVAHGMRQLVGKKHSDQNREQR